MTNDVKPVKITAVTMKKQSMRQTVRNIYGDQGNMEQNFWEQGNSVKVNFREHLNLFLRNKGTTVNFHREQGNMHPPGGPSKMK